MPNSVVRNLENKLKLEHEIAISKLTDEYETRIENLEKDLTEAIKTINTQNDELKKYTDKTHTSIAQKFLHISRINQLKNKVSVNKKSLTEMNEQ